MDKKTYESLKAVIDYLYSDEKEHWEENDKPIGHVFVDVKRLEKYARKIAKNYI